MALSGSSSSTKIICLVTQVCVHLEHYFSRETLAADVFLLKNMDSEGYGACFRLCRVFMFCV